MHTLIQVGCARGPGFGSGIGVSFLFYQGGFSGHTIFAGFYFHDPSGDGQLDMESCGLKPCEGPCSQEIQNAESPL